MDTRLTALRKENELGTDVSQQIEELAQMTVSQLRERYIEVFGEESRSNHKQFLFRRIAWRIQALAFKAVRRLYPDYPLWRDFAYEYERGKLAIDVINGGPLLREWVDDASATPHDLDVLARSDEQAWSTKRLEYLRYGRP